MTSWVAGCSAVGSSAVGSSAVGCSAVGSSAAGCSPVAVGSATAASAGVGAAGVPAWGVTARVAATSEVTTSAPAASGFSACGGEGCCAPLPGLSVLDTSGSLPRPIRKTRGVTAVPGGLWAAPAPVAVALAFCPSAPLLLPVVEGRPAEETSALRRACDEAVAAMLAVAPGVVVVVADGAAPGVCFGSGDVGDLRGYGVDVAVPFAGPGGGGARGVATAPTDGGGGVGPGGGARGGGGVGARGGREAVGGPPR